MEAEEAVQDLTTGEHLGSFEGPTHGLRPSEREAIQTKRAESLHDMAQEGERTGERIERAPGLCRRLIRLLHLDQGQHLSGVSDKILPWFHPRR